MPSTANVRRAQKAEREATKAAEQSANKAKAEADAYWSAAGDGKKSKAAARADEDAAKADAKAAARAEARRQAELEEAEFAGGKGSSGAKKKVTAYDLAQGKEMDAKARLRAKFAAKKAEKKEVAEDEYAKTVDAANDNRKVDVVAASGIDAALDALAVGERSASPAPLTGRAAYAAFEAEKLAELKAEKPGLRKQQYDDLLSKLWARSPQNPANQQK